MASYDWPAVYVADDEVSERNGPQHGWADQAAHGIQELQKEVAQLSHKKGLLRGRRLEIQKTR